MSQSTVNGANVVSGVITMPRVGAWRADLDIDLEDSTKLSGKLSLTVDEMTWVGRAVEIGSFSGRTKLRMVGGAGGLAKTAKPKFFASMPARVALADVLAEGAEVLSQASDKDRLGTILPLWTRPEGPVSEGLEHIVDELGATWRVLPDGSVWVGVETWPNAKEVKNVLVLQDLAHEARLTFGSEVPNLLPGKTFQSRKVSRVEIVIQPNDVRSTAWFEVAGSEGSADVFRGAVQRVVRQATRHVDYHAIYGGRVVSQNGDGSLEIKLDAPQMPGMSRVPIAYGIPGITATVRAGARLLVEFEGGSPSRPRAVVTDSAALQSITLKASQKVVVDAPDVEVQNGRPLARLGDMVRVLSTPPGTPAIGQIVTANKQHRG